MINTPELCAKAVQDLHNALTVVQTLADRADVSANQIAQIYCAADTFLDGFAELRRVYLAQYHREQPRRTVRRATH
jgi:hypothetical protein